MNLVRDKRRMTEIYVYKIIENLIPQVTIKYNTICFEM